MGLCVFPELNRASIRRGIEYLLSNQKPDGFWDEHLQTGTGFPGVIYLRYDYYRIYWPLRALAIYASSSRGYAASEDVFDRVRVQRFPSDIQPISAVQQ